MESNAAQPGQTIAPTPSGGTDQSSSPATPPDPKPSETPQPTPPPEPQPQPPTPEPAPPPEEVPDRPPFEAADAAAPPQSAPEPEADDDGIEPVAWTASEFIAHAKSFKWYAALFAAAVVFAALVFLVSHDYVSVGVVLAAALIFGIYAGHQPRELQYRVDGSGLTIGHKHFAYAEFRSFSVLPEGAFSSIVFMPLRRFAVPTTIYYAPEDEDKIVSLLGSYLPIEERGHDAVDRLMHRIHF
jgi:hypothetical protein